MIENYFQNRPEAYEPKMLIIMVSNKIKTS